MRPHLVTKLTSKHQTTIPQAVRRKLGVGGGDAVQFVIRADEVVIQRADPLDPIMLALTAEVFSDWDSPEADEAFKHL